MYWFSFFKKGAEKMGTTYGKNDHASNIEEAAYFQPHHEIRRIEKEILLLEQKKQKIIDSCNHHFVPKNNIIGTLGETLVENVYAIPGFAGIGDDGRLVTEVTFDLHCIGCQTEHSVDVSQHCPVCANKTVNKQVGSGPSGIGKYFRDYPYYVVPIQISCTKCDFVSVVTLGEELLTKYKRQLSFLFE